MPDPNGAGELPSGAPKRLLRTRPRTREYIVNRDGEDVTLTGYYAGDACPIWVAIEVQAANDDYVAATASLLQELRLPDGTIQRRMKPGTRVGAVTAPSMRQRQAILCAVMRGLTEEEAAVMAADGGDWQDVLIELGWHDPDPVQAREDDDPEATGEDSTSDGSSPDSASTTPALIS